MKFDLIDDNTFIIYVNSFYKKINNDNQLDVIKKLLILVRKRYAYNIYGFYEVNVYKIDNITTLLVFKKIDNDGLFYKTIDLKIINNDEKPKIVIDDFLLNNKKDIYKICEHYSINLHN